MKMPRRRFLQSAGVASGCGWPIVGSAVSPAGATKSRHPALAEAIERMSQDYLTPQGDFYNVERGNPLPYKLPLEKRLEVGLERDTWQLEILSASEDADDEALKGKAVQLDNPMSRERGNAFTFADLVKLGESKAVRFLKVVSCNNLSDPLGIGLWEGVPLRDVLWQARPKANYRSVYYDGYHNEDPKQLFQCWLPANRVLEDPPGFLPVILCYKINGEWLTGERGGPVRMIVPEAYGFKSVKWLQRVVVTNQYQPRDTYALQNNDVNDSWLKTRALFEALPGQLPADEAFALSGQAQVGIGGLSKVQWWAQLKGEAWDDDDPFFERAPWQDAELLPLPEKWAGHEEALPDALLPMQFDPATRRPREWPLRYTLCSWVALVPPMESGRYVFRCRAIDAKGNAQPMPRPYRKSGRSEIVKQEILLQA